MGMTMTQKILAAHAGLDRVEAGQLIEANFKANAEVIYGAVLNAILKDYDGDME